MKSISKIKVLAAGAAVLFGSVAFGGVYDDAIWWFNKPYDTGSKPGVLETGEMLDALTGGVPTANQHKGVVYGYDESRSNVTMTVKTAYFEKNLPVVFMSNIIKDGNIFPGNADISVPLKDLRPTTITEFSSVTRFNWDGNSHSTAWMFNANNGKLDVGVISGKIRVWPSDAVGGTSGISALPVTANKWYDLGVSIVKGGGADGKNLLNIILVKDDGTKYTYVDDTYSGFPCSVSGDSNSTRFNFATENLKTKELLTTDSNANKYFTGAIQQMAFWNRVLTEDEFLEAFTYSNGDKSVVGVANASGDEFGGTGTDIVMDGDWRDVPKTLAAGGTYMVQFAGAVDSARLFKVKGVSGATTLQVGAASAPITDGGEAEFFVPRSSMSEEGGVVSFVFQNTGAADLTLDCLSLTDNAVVTNYVTYTTSNVDTNLVVEQDRVLVIDIPQGYFINMNGVISGEGQVVKAGLGTLKLITAPTVTGGIAVREGVLRAADNNLLGSAPVTVIANGTTPSQLSLNGTFANNIYVEGESSDACPAIHFAAKTTLNGDLIGSNAVVYLSTAWEDTAAQANTENVTIAGRVDATGGTVALAPHCKVNFKKTIYCELLKLYWRPNSATEDGGNPGIVVLASHGDRKNGPATAIQCYMKNVEIDQTRIIQGGQNIFGSSNGYQADWPCATVRWTGEHKTGGSIDMNGNKMNMGRVYTFETDADDYTSQRIINTGGNTPFCNLLDNVAGCFYAQLEGSLNCQATGNSKAQILKNRHHRGVTFSGSLISAITGGTTFEGGATISSSASIQITNLTAGAYIKDTTLTFGSSTAWVMDLSAVDALATDYSLSLISTKAGKLSAPAGLVLRFKKATCTSAIPAGTYANTFSGTAGSFTLTNGGTIRIATTDGTPSDLGAIHWDGEKWVDAGGGEVTPGVAAGYTVTNTEGTDDALLGNDVNLYGIDLACAVGGRFTLGSADNALVRVWGSGFNVSSTESTAGTAITINAPIEFQNSVNNVIRIPTNGTCTLNGGISGRGNVTLDGSADAACGHPSPYNTSVAKGETDGGVFYLNGDNTFSGNLTASNAVVHVKGTLGLPGDTSTFYARADSGQDANKVYHHYMGNFYFKGFDCYKAMDVKSGSSSDPNYGYAVIFDAGTTNTFHSTFHWNSSTIVRFLADSQTMFKKTVTFDNTVKLYPSAGAVLDFEGPLRAPNTEKANVGIAGGAGSHVIFNAKGNVSGTFLNFSGADMIIDINETDAFQIGTYFQLGDAANQTCTLNLNNGARISAPEFLTSDNVTIHGEGVGAAVEITDGSTEKHAVKCQLTGTAGLVMSGDGTCNVSGCRGTSTGELVAKSGVIAMDAASTWAGAVRVYENAGTLDLTGVKKVAAIYVNDSTESLPEGLYGSLDSTAPNKVAWITGTGKLRIGNAGMLFIVK